MKKMILMRFGPRSNKAISREMAIIVALSFIIAISAGYYFLTVKTPSVAGQTTTTLTNQITNTVTSQVTSTVTTQLTSVETSTVTSVSYTGSEAYTSSDTSTTSQTSTTSSSAPPRLLVSGSITTTGQGTQPTSITFAGSAGTFATGVAGGKYSITLPNEITYEVSIAWSGAYPWQGGSASFQLYVNETASSSLTSDWVVSTPPSLVEVSGSVTATGSGTQATKIIFVGSHGENYSSAVIAGQYNIELPNMEGYTTSANWSGSHSWQIGSASLGTLSVNQSEISTMTRDWQTSTPNSNIEVSGNITATGSGTRPSGITFSGGAYGTYSTALNGNHYSISLPNKASFNVTIGWSGKYSWQNGSANSGQFQVNVASSSTTYIYKNWNAQTPNSDIVVSGTILTSGSSTSAISITFSGAGGTFRPNVSSGHYSITLPNQATYTADVQWKGEYSWQNGTTNFQLNLYAGAGASTFEADWLVPTPDSTITVSGTIKSSSGTPYLVRFVSSDGEVNLTAQVIGNDYNITLPNDISYTVTVYLSGASTAQCGVGVLELYATPGVSDITINWSC